MATINFDNLLKWADQQNKNIGQVIRATILDVSKDVILRTPVDTGNLVANWIPTLNAPSTALTTVKKELKDDIKAPKSEKNKKQSIVSDRQNEINTVIKDAVGKVFYLSNNVSYAKKIENGFSDQAPAGMLKVSVNNFNQRVEREIKRVKS